MDFANADQLPSFLKLLIKINMATDEGYSWNETWHWTNNEIGVALQSWLWVRVELVAW